MFTVLFGVSSGGQSFRLSSLVGEVWVVCYYLFLCGLLSLSLSCMDQVGIFCYIYSLANYVSINYFFSVLRQGQESAKKEIIAYNPHLAN